MKPAIPMTSFIGREQALSESRALLETARLVTITGVGGIGKTRLAAELVGRESASYPEGVGTVELAAVTIGGEVAPVVAAALGVTDQSTRSASEQIVRHLSGRRTLLFVDNCEHVLEAAAELIAELLDAVDGLSIIATSREPLGIPGEQNYPLGPLAMPAVSRRHDPTAVHEAEAVRLLTERAQAFIPQFEVTDANRAAVVQLCDRLDGMPLAIELAAARLRTLSVEQVLDRLDERFTLLTGGTRADLPRHRTLWDLVDWSHELCTRDEQRLWARLSIFPGTFDLEAVESICSDDDLTAIAILDVLDRLVVKSIVTAEQTGPAMRYRMLVTMREYGSRKLDELSERAAVTRRHRDHYLDRAESMVEQWCGPAQAESLAGMRRDHANLIAALEWSIATPGEQQEAARLGSLLRYHWIAGGHLSDGRRWLERILAIDSSPTSQCGGALWVAAWVCLIQGDRTAARKHLDACRDVAAVLGDEVLEAHADHWTGLMQLFSGDTAAAIQSYQAALAVFDRVGDLAAVQTAGFQLAMAQTYDGATDAALETCARVLDLSARQGEQWCRAYSLWVMGICQWHRRDAAASLEAGRAALELQRAFQDGICIALTVELLSWLACDAEHPERAAELAGAGASVWHRLGTTIEAFGPDITADSQRMTREVDRSLGDKKARSLRLAQADLTRLETVEFALNGRRAEALKASAGGPLTPREFEVAQLIAQGMSNRAIAERLVISVRTVDGHVERILAKLEFYSRTQVATWATLNA